MPVAVDEMLMVQNNQGGPTVFTHGRAEARVELEWKGKGDPDGEDLQPVPASIVRGDVNFARSVRRGIFTVVDADEETTAILDRQADAWRARQDKAEKAAVEAIDPTANNDIVTLPCVGPNNRGNGTCGQPVTVREKTKSDHAPLCSQHEGLRGEFVMTQTDKIVDGKATIEWQRMSQTLPERQQQR